MGEPRAGDGLYEAALEVYTHEALPEDWARTQMNLANTYCDRIRGKRAEYIELVPVV